MKTLPRGITGFWKIGTSPPPNIDIALIESKLAMFRKNLMFRTVKCTQPAEDTNFYIISIFGNKEKYMIGINGSYPYFCGIQSLQDWTAVEFCDLPPVVVNILKPEFTELKTEFLNTPLKEEHLIFLSKAEREQIEYWETEKIGNIIFNKYD